MSIENPPADKGKNKPAKNRKPLKTSARKVKGAPEVGVTENVVKIFKPTLPSVNMRPGYIGLQYKKIDLFKKMIFAMVGVILLFIGVFAGNIVLTLFQENQNQQMIEEIEELKERSGDVEPYKVYVDSIEQLRKNMSLRMAQDLDMGLIINFISEAASTNNITITSLQVSDILRNAKDDVCAESDAAANNKVGCIVLSGAAGSRDEVLTFFDTLEQTDGLSGGFISEVGSEGAAITFKGTIYIESSLFSKRGTFLIEAIGDILRNGGLKKDEGFTEYSPSTGSALDPQFVSCQEANNAGYGPYTVGVDPEYQWYVAEDIDSTGIVCVPPIVEETPLETQDGTVIAEEPETEVSG